MNRDDMKRIILMLKGAFVEFNPPDLTSTIDAYYESLKEYPLASVEYAAMAVMKTARYFPRIADLIGLADKHSSTVERIDPMALHKLEVEMHEQAGPDWLWLAGQYRANGYEDCAKAIERRAAGVRAEWMIE